MADDTKADTKADSRSTAKTAEKQPQAETEITEDDRDALNMGVPMADEVDPRDEPTGPEDALGEGPTRGDYSDRIGPSNYHPHQVVPGAQREDGSFEPVIQAQRDFVEQGSTPAGKKGGVDSAQK